LGGELLLGVLTRLHRGKVQGVHRGELDAHAIGIGARGDVDDGEAGDEVGAIHDKTHRGLTAHAMSDEVHGAERETVEHRDDVGRQRGIRTIFAPRRRAVVTQVRREHAMAAFGEGHAGGLPVARRTQQAVQDHERRTGAAQFADDQRKRRAHGRRQGEGRPAEVEPFPRRGLNPTTHLL